MKTEALLTRKIGKWNASIYLDEENKVVTIAYMGKGGAIASGKNYAKAEKKFIRMMTLFDAIQKINIYSKLSKYINC